MSEFKCQNGDVIRVGGVYVWQFYTEPKIFAVTEIDRDHFLDQNKTRGMIENLRHELARDEDGYYIWGGGEQPVPDDWFVEVKLDTGSLSRSSASNYGWAISDSDDARNITAFRVVSTGEKANTPSWNETVAEIPYRGGPLEFEDDQDALLDMVNSPPHYQLREGYEVYDLRQDLAKKAQAANASHAAYSDWDRAIEYLVRMWDKNGLEDAKKAKWYLEMLIDKLEHEE